MRKTAVRSRANGVASDKKESVSIVADDERSDDHYIASHTVIDPGEDGDAVRSRCRASPAEGCGGEQPPLSRSQSAKRSAADLNCSGTEAILFPEDKFTTGGG